MNKTWKLLSQFQSTTAFWLSCKTRPVSDWLNDSRIISSSMLDELRRYSKVEKVRESYFKDEKQCKALRQYAKKLLIAIDLQYKIFEPWDKFFAKQNYFLAYSAKFLGMQYKVFAKTREPFLRWGGGVKVSPSSACCCQKQSSNE